MPLADDTFGSLVATPLLIFCARLLDVPLATLRIILLSRGLKKVAPLVGFFEVLVWLIAIGQVMQHLDRWVNYVAYAGGFAAGTWLGIALEGRLALGLLSVRVITADDATDLIQHLRAEKFGVTDFAARGISGNVRLIFTVIQRKELARVMEIVRSIHPKAFVSISDVRSVSEGFIYDRSVRAAPRLWGRSG
jgi:uncharacterized protein YebE (UPF0316 family)